MSASEIFFWSLGLCICLVRVNVLRSQQRHITDLAIDNPLHGKPTNLQFILPPSELLPRPKDVGRFTLESTLVQHQWHTSL